MKKTILLVVLLILCAGCAAQKDKYYGIDHFYIKEEGDAFREAADHLCVDTYNWYKSIEGEDGVYLMHFEHYSKEILEEWKATGYMKNIPENELDYYVASVNYLEERGMEITNAEKQLVRDGVRLYLIPDTLSEEETEALKAFLTEDALQGLDQESLIDTVFQWERKIEFRNYHPEATLEIPGGGEISDPVIFVAGCENMKYFESESLFATGVVDGYIRLNEEAYQKYAKNLPTELKEKRLTFKGISRIKN